MGAGEDAADPGVGGTGGAGGRSGGEESGEGSSGDGEREEEQLYELSDSLDTADASAGGGSDAGGSEDLLIAQIVRGLVRAVAPRVVCGARAAGGAVATVAGDPLPTAPLGESVRAPVGPVFRIAPGAKAWGGSRRRLRLVVARGLQDAATGSGSPLGFGLGTDQVICGAGLPPAAQPSCIRRQKSQS